MKTRTCILAVAGALASAGWANAQDSVSLHGGLPGDAINAHAASDAINDFVVDLTAFESSKGNLFVIGPVQKTSLEDPFSGLFFNHLVNGQAISNTVHPSVPFLRNSYSVWSGQGFGVSDDAAANSPGTPVNTVGAQGRQFSIGMDEFGGVNENVISSIINYSPELPSRLYVSRIVSATNSIDFSCSLGAFGFGGIDSDGNVHVRMDPFGGTDCIGLGGTDYFNVVDNNLFRVDNTARTLVENFIGLATAANPATITYGDPAAVVQLLSADPNVHNTPTIIPEQVAGRPIMIGGNFLTQYVYELAAGSLTPTLAHFPVCATDQRGNVSYSRHNFLPGSVNGTSAMLFVDAFGETTGLGYWGLDATGGPVFASCALVPTPIMDNDDGTILGAGTGSIIEADMYHSQIAFQGGNGQIALGVDQQDRLLIAAQVDHPLDLGPSHAYNAIAVARVTGGGPTEWTVAGYCLNRATLSWGTQVGNFVVGETVTQAITGSTGTVLSVTNGNPGSMVIDVFSSPFVPGAFAVTGGTSGATVATLGGSDAMPSGKAICDASGTQIGQMVDLGFVTGGAPIGPSMSSPMIDSVGNVYFIAAIETFGPMMSDFDSALLKAIYDPASFSYKLEKIMEVGDVFLGQNSGTNWQLRFMNLADNNSASSSTAFSGNMHQMAYNLTDPATLDTRDSTTLGGMVIGASIVYDANGDGDYISPGQDPLTPDESYNVALYIAGAPDCNDNGNPDDRDIDSGASMDSNNNGIPDECELGVTNGTCAGDGSYPSNIPAICPCGNTSAGGSGEGCINSSLANGGTLADASGSSASFTSDNLRLDATHPNGNSGLLLVNTSIFNPGVAVFDGLACVGGGPRTLPGSDNGGVQPFGDVDLVAGDGVRNLGGTTPGSGLYGLVNATFPGFFAPGGTYYAQFWYRDVLCGPPPSPCNTVCTNPPPAAANFTNAVSWTVTP